VTLPPFGSDDPFSDLLSRFFGMSPLSSPPAVQRVPIGRLLSDSARTLLATASDRATADGSSDLDSAHLLWAATQVEQSRHLLERAGIDPAQLAEDLQGALPTGPGAGGEPGGEPSLTPAAKRALLAAHARSQRAGASYIGPEHILGALFGEDRSGAGQALRNAAPSEDTLRTAMEGRGTGGERVPSAGAVTPRPWTSTAATSPRRRVRAGSTPWWGGPRRSSRPSRSSPGGPRTTPC
jgi:ATP-dependent Clp protease ATP-binding subunit ClpC